MKQSCSERKGDNCLSAIQKPRNKDSDSKTPFPEKLNEAIVFTIGKSKKEYRLNNGQR